MSKIRAIFMGTPEFGIESAEVLRESAKIVGVVTQPDKAGGRGYKLRAPAMKEWAQERGIRVLQPARIKEAEEEVRELKPEIIIVVAYGQILPQSILEMPKYGCINVHASLLPKYRGAAPIEWALINGEEKTGVTTMRMEAGLDTGEMLIKREVAISKEMILPELEGELKRAGAEALRETLEGLIGGTLKGEKQDETLSSYAPKVSKELGRINWLKPAESIHNLVRGLYGRAYTQINGRKYKIWRTRVIEEKLSPGQRIEKNERLLIGAGRGALEVEEIQAPNGKKLQISEFLRGHKQEIL